MGKSEANTVAWIFLAISFWDKRHVTRVEILHSADAINHAVPLESELQLAIRVLTKQGLVNKNGRFFEVADSGRVMLDSAHSGAVNVFDAWKKLETAIGSLAAV
jgi:hypothetical protein